MRFALVALLLTTPLAAQDTTRPMSENAAYRLSLWATVIPVAAATTIMVVQRSGGDFAGPNFLGSLGLFVGPSMGYFSAGLGGRGLKGLGIRVGLSAATVGAAFAVCGMDCTGGSKLDAANVIVLGGAGLIVVSAIYDISHLRQNVRRRTDRTTNRLSLTPAYEGAGRAGLRIRLAF
ncbi:MAG TPA: hypothetical protein VKC15_11725 [Gemmatimonadales bacterium]|nr:hypothetical protein [Gemmatimonadales bacterium]